MSIENTEQEITSPLQALVVDYVGEKLKPKDDLVTSEMILEVFIKEFPNFVLFLAEENYMRGYEEAVKDMEFIEKEAKEPETKEIE